MRPVTHIRSTTISSSILSLQSRGLYEAYLSKLKSAADREAIRSIVSGQWTPISLAVAHYHALDAMQLGPSMIDAMGAAVSARLQGGNFLGAIVQAAKSVGVTPWAICGQYPKLWERLFIGGGVVVRKTGPKDAIFEAHHLSSLTEIPYFRQGYVALHRAGLELFARRVVVREVTDSNSRCFSVRAAWV